MARCALCHLVFPSRLQLVEHFSEAHSIARQRSRRSRVIDAIRKVTLEAHVPEVVTLTELQRHWQIAHKYSMACKNLKFEDEKSFTDWLITEEEKHKRNKRNRDKQFQDLKGNEKLLHRQKLERLARLAGRESRIARNTRIVEFAGKLENIIVNDRADDPSVQVDHNLMESDELFSSEVEMVLDGQFDMGPEELAGPVVTPLDSLHIFPNDRGSQVTFKEEEEGISTSDDQMQEQQTCQKEEEEVVIEETGGTVQVVLPATSEDWSKVFEMVRARVAKEEDATIKAAAALLLPYERVIELVTPAEQVPIFRQLMMIAIKLNSHKYSILSSNNTLYRGEKFLESGRYLIECRFIIVTLEAKQSCGYSMNKRVV
ncbi:hypothetical protein E2C01_044358 [Portunus trituberculatus]|uniref:C2H2-type domain-containing protein n=1 Tax=Portunus trituberculatus TaxID=210409 RepID=A0A5B7FZ39_PORTR|nr:hypothetical protein [Portunus trituberculatus]